LKAWANKWGLIVVLLALPVYYGIKDLADTGSLSHLGQNLLAGLSNGSIWALIAVGYTLVYGIIELINFAHGDVFMIGSFVTAGLFGTIGLVLAAPLTSAALRVSADLAQARAGITRSG